MERIKLNLGCGYKILPGYVNVDKFGAPDMRHDLEVLPWPWLDNSVQEIQLHHVLEHLGQETGVFLRIMQELYRVCSDGAKIHIKVPHPNHEDFIGDPSHVRPITPSLMQLFSKKCNKEWVANGNANTPFALYLDVDFDIVSIHNYFEASWYQKYLDGQITEAELQDAAKHYNNVIAEIGIELTVIKQQATT